jgi:hypothetical protein
MLDVCRGKEEQRVAYVRISPGEWGNSGLEPEVRCVGERGFKNSEQVEKEDTRAGDKL